MGKRISRGWRRLGRIILLACMLLGPAGLGARPAAAAPRVDLDTAAPLAVEGGLKDGSTAWADYDNDGDLDLLVTGNTITGASETSIFTNDNGSLLRFSLGLPGVQSSSGEWGDYDNDGYLDVLLTGLRSIGDTQVLYSAVYHNVPDASPPAPGIERQFTLFQELQPIYRGAGVWGDYNNDGRSDILLTGYTTGDQPFSRIYTNMGSSFNPATSITVTALGSSAAAWSDFDNDGYTDFAITGRDISGNPVARVFRNNQSGGFSATALPTGLWAGTVTFFDANNDGTPELLLTGNSGTDITPNIQPQALLYRYTSSTAPYFSLVASSGLTGVWSSSVTAGDYNHDGLIDLAVAGLTASGKLNRVYTNTGGLAFTTAHTLPEISGLAVDWGDFDLDGALDLAVSGVNASTGTPPVERYFLYIYANDAAPLPPANAAPTAPTLSAACWDGASTLTLEWNAASDDHNTPAALTYNLRMGSAPGLVDTVSPGFIDPGMRAPQVGNVFRGTSAVLRGLPGGTYYWSVQAVDAAYTTSPFPADGVVNMGVSVALPDSYTNLSEDPTSPYSLTVLANDDGGGEDLILKSYTTPRYGSLVRSPDPNVLLYMPSANFYGADSFTYYAQRAGSLYCSRTTVSIIVNNENDAPTDIRLTNDDIAAGLPVGTEIGRFTTVDIDAGQTYTYALVPDASGSSHDNAFFSLFVNSSYTPPATFLRSARVFPVDGRTSYQIYVRSTDNGTRADGTPYPRSVEKLLTIHVITGIQATSITLDDNHITEKQVPNSIVGQLLTYYGTTQYPNDTSYQLVADGSGETYDNDLFLIPVGPPWNLRTTVALNYDEANPDNNTYQVYVRSSHISGTSLDQLLTVLVDPTLPELVGFDDSNTVRTGSMTVSASEEIAKTINLRATDLGLGETLRWDIYDPPDHGTASVAPGDTTSGVNKTASYTSALNYFGNDSFIVRVRDSDNNPALITVNVVVANVNDPPTLNPIAPMTVDELSGSYEVILTGISAGPENETGQYLTVTPTWMGWPARLGALWNPTTSAVRADGTATLRFTVGVGPGTYNLILVVSDRQSTFARYLTITVRARSSIERMYAPALRK